jgi:hypothetical protein
MTIGVPSNLNDGVVEVQVIDERMMARSPFDKVSPLLDNSLEPVCGQELLLPAAAEGAVELNEALIFAAAILR